MACDVAAHVPGLFHVVFGAAFGSLLALLTRHAEDGRRFDATLVFVFAVNNYLGPDFGNFLKKIARALESDALFKFGESVHSYFGWVLFSALWAPVWFGIVKAFDRSRAKFDRGGNPVVHSYPVVHLTVLAAGICHHFTDLVGHADDYGGVYGVRGRFQLLAVYDAQVYLSHAIAAGILAGAYVLVRVLATRGTGGGAFEGLAAQARRFFKSPGLFSVLVVSFVGFLDVVAMYAVMDAGGLVDHKTQVLRWSGTVLTTTYFNWGNAMWNTLTYAVGAAPWYTATLIVGFVAAYSFVHGRGVRVRVGGADLSGEGVVVASFLALAVVGYLLQPLIGNVSNQEFDFGALVGLWSTLGYASCALLLALAFNSNGKVPPQA
ncbi:MAG: hypothetical protein Kow0069_08920 [Promethearchaeota archaeon]